MTVFVLNIFASLAWGQNKKPTAFAELTAYLGPDREQILLAGAKSEGKVVWYTSLGGGSYKAIIDAFEAKYPGVKVEVYRATGSDLVTRIIEETNARRNIVDTVESTGEVLAALREAKLLAPFNSPYLRNYPLAGKQRAEKELYYWAIARESYVGFGYNKSKLPASAVPNNFDGLLNPELKGRFALGTGGSGAEMIGAMLKVKGEAFVKKLKAQEIRLFSLGAPAIRDQVASGEIEAAPVFQTHALEAAEKGAPIEWLPMDIVPTHAGAAVVMAKPAHPRAALLMADFLISPDGQHVLERFKYGSAAKEYGFKRWYLETDLSREKYEQEVTKWENLMQSIVKRGS
jgi:iron(III) transport system substrate-binding protein